MKKTIVGNLTCVLVHAFCTIVQAAFIGQSIQRHEYFWICWSGGFLLWGLFWTHHFLVKLVGVS